MESGASVRTHADSVEHLIDDVTMMSSAVDVLERVRIEMLRIDGIKRGQVLLFDNEIGRFWNLDSSGLFAGDWNLEPRDHPTGLSAIEGVELRLSADDRRSAPDGVDPDAWARSFEAWFEDDTTELLIFPLDSSRRTTGAAAFSFAAGHKIESDVAGELRAITAVLTMALEKVAAIEEINRRLEGLRGVHEELANTNTELETFAQMASSDLQQPLGQIKRFADRLERGASSEFEGREFDYLERIGGATDRMQNLIGDLLTFSRVSTAEAPIQDVDLETLMSEALMDLELMISDAGGVVTVDPLPVVAGNATQLRQLFQNVVGNAIKYRHPNVCPEVSVVVVDQGVDRFQLEFRDNGIGFEAKHADRIFKPFQRLHSRSQFEGSGIGLAVCRRIVERHGGTMSASSGEGGGSVFAVSLPKEIIVR